MTLPGKPREARPVPQPLHPVKTMKTLNPEAVKVLVGTGRGLRFTESPRWRDSRFIFIDIHDSAVKAVDLEGKLETLRELPFKPNGLGIRPDGRFVLTDALHLQVLQDGADGLEPFADLSDMAVFCLSDGLVDAQGRYYVSDIGYNFWDPSAPPSRNCVINRVDPDGAIARVADGLAFPNGMVITSDGRTLIIAETDGQCLTAYDIAPDGGLSGRRVYAQLPEGVQPDGIVLDAEGAVWLANPAGSPTVLRVAEGGEVLATLDLPIHAYAVMLGGPERPPPLHQHFSLPRRGGGHDQPNGADPGA